MTWQEEVLAVFSTTSKLGWAETTCRSLHNLAARLLVPGDAGRALIDQLAEHAIESAINSGAWDIEIEANLVGARTFLGLASNAASDPLTKLALRDVAAVAARSAHLGVTAPKSDKQGRAYRPLMGSALVLAIEMIAREASTSESKPQPSQPGPTTPLTAISWATEDLDVNLDDHLSATLVKCEDFAERMLALDWASELSVAWAFDGAQIDIDYDEKASARLYDSLWVSYAAADFAIRQIPRVPSGQRWLETKARTDRLERAFGGFHASELDRSRDYFSRHVSADPRGVLRVIRKRGGPAHIFDPIALNPSRTTTSATSLSLRRGWDMSRVQQVIEVLRTSMTGWDAGRRQIHEEIDQANILSGLMTGRDSYLPTMIAFPNATVLRRRLELTLYGTHWPVSVAQLAESLRIRDLNLEIVRDRTDASVRELLNRERPPSGLVDRLVVAQRIAPAEVMIARFGPDWKRAFPDVVY